MVPRRGLVSPRRMPLTNIRNFDRNYFAVYHSCGLKTSSGLGREVKDHFVVE